MSNRLTARRFSRRRLLIGLGALLATGAATFGYGRYGEPDWTQIDEITLPTPNLPEQLAGTRFAQISDIHLGAYFTAEQLLAAIERVNQLDVEWLMLTGDFVTTRERNRSLRSASRAQAAAALVEPLRRAQVPLFAAVGNHDLWGGLEVIEQYLREANVTLLRNSAIALQGGLWLAAVDDVWSGRPDLQAALRDMPAGAVNLLMAHEPDYFDTVVAQDAPVAAQFSGHSHGGQVRLPTLLPGPDGLFTYAPVLPEYSERYPIGLRHVQGRHIYTNRGLGTWPVPYRINCPPEITVFTLQPL